MEWTSSLPAVTGIPWRLGACGGRRRNGGSVVGGVVGFSGLLGRTSHRVRPGRVVCGGLAYGPLASWRKNRRNPPARQLDLQADSLPCKGGWCGCVLQISIICPQRFIAASLRLLGAGGVV